MVEKEDTILTEGEQLNVSHVWLWPRVSSTDLVIIWQTNFLRTEQCTICSRRSVYESIVDKRFQWQHSY
jgi:hypothetical protein